MSPSPSKAVQLADPRSVQRAGIGRKLNKTEAIELTQRINATKGQLLGLVAIACDRKAWQALGYSSWKEYAEIELEVGESRSYQMVDQGRIMLAIAEIVGDPDVVNTTVHITQRQAALVKPHLSTFKKELATALKAEFPLTEAVEEAIYSVPTTEKQQRVPRSPSRTIEGELVDSREAQLQADLEAAQQRLLEQFQAQTAGGKGKAKAGVTDTMFSQKVCSHCHGTGFVRG